MTITENDPSAWKWAIISLHNALQGAMTCHLSGTANLGCLSKQSACAWLEWHDKRSEGAKRPNEYMATPQVLFDRLYKEKLRVEGGCGAILQITLNQRKSFKLLNELRNQFSHFTPMGWSIETSGLPRVFNDMLAVIEMITDDPWSFRHLDACDRAEHDTTLDELIQNIGSRQLV